jgi:hypothetical protein
MIWGSNPEGGRISHTCPSGPSNLQYSVYRVSFPVVKQPGHGIEQPLLSSVEVKERAELAVLVLHNWASIACSRLNITVHTCFVSYMPCINVATDHCKVSLPFIYPFSFATTKYSFIQVVA